MEFLKKHYEKIILCVVLLGVAVTAALLMMNVQSVREDIESQGKRRTGAKKAGLAGMDLTTNEIQLARLSKPVSFDFNGEHNLANPVRWVKDKSGQVIPDIKGLGIGANGLNLIRTEPLYLLIKFVKRAGEGADLRYQFTIERQYEKKADKRRETLTSVTAGGTTSDRLFRLVEVKGSPESPSDLVIELLDTGEKVTVNTANPYRRVGGYLANVGYRWDVNNKKFLNEFNNKRVDETLGLEGISYKIVAITKEEVVVSDSRSNKRTTVREKTAR